MTSHPSPHSPQAGRVSLLAFCTGLLMALVLPPSSAATAPQEFHFAPEEALALQPAELREPLGSGVTACAAACVRHIQEYGHSYTFQAAGMARPVRSHIWIEVERPTVAVPVAGCAVQLFAQVLAPNGDNKWYWAMCAEVDPALMALGGLIEVDVEWPADYSAVAVQPRDRLLAMVATGSTSTPEAPTVHLVADATHPSTLALAGTNEPVPAPSSPGPSPSPETATPAPSPEPSSAPPATSPPPSTTAPPASATAAPASPPTSAAPSGATSGGPATPPSPAAKGSPAAGLVMTVGLLGLVAAARRRLP